MGNRVNIAGATFGRLTAITPTDKRVKDGGVIWKCKCECGRLCFVKAAYLTKGHTKSCGCLSRDNCRWATRTEQNYNRRPYKRKK